MKNKVMTEDIQPCVVIDISYAVATMLYTNVFLIPNNFLINESIPKKTTKSWTLCQNRRLIGYFGAIFFFIERFLKHP